MFNVDDILNNPEISIKAKLSVLDNLKAQLTISNGVNKIDSHIKDLKDTLDNILNDNGKDVVEAIEDLCSGIRKCVDACGVVIDCDKIREEVHNSKFNVEARKIDSGELSDEEKKKSWARIDAIDDIETYVNSIHVMAHDMIGIALRKDVFNDIEKSKLRELITRLTAVCDDFDNFLLNKEEVSA